MSMSGKDKMIVWLEDVRNTDIPIVGGKGASLGEMINAELPVPRGFVVTAQAFRKFIEDAGIADKLFKGLEVDVDDQKELAKAETFAKGLIKDQPMPKEIADAIRSHYETLCARSTHAFAPAVDFVNDCKILLQCQGWLGPVASPIREAAA